MKEGEARSLGRARSGWMRDDRPVCPGQLGRGWVAHGAGGAGGS